MYKINFSAHIVIDISNINPNSLRITKLIWPDMSNLSISNFCFEKAFQFAAF